MYLSYLYNRITFIRRYLHSNASEFRPNLDLDLLMIIYSENRQGSRCSYFTRMNVIHMVKT